MGPPLSPPPLALQQRRTHPRRVTTLLVAAVLGAACGADAPRAVIHTTSGPRIVHLEVADTPGARQRGLMYRRDLADGDGMLFVFDQVDRHTFWMKNTFISLDMLFVGPEGTVVGIHERAVPHSTVPVGVDAPSRWVIEVPGGWASRAGVALGDRVEFADLEAP